MGVSNLAVPTLAVPLMDYQQESVQFALTRRSAYLALDMGLGKTAVAIAIATAVAQQEHRQVLIVVPPSLRTNWVREFGKFSPDLSIHVFDKSAPTPTIRVPRMVNGSPLTVDGKKVMDEVPNPNPPTLPTSNVLIVGDSTVEGWAHWLSTSPRPVGAVIVDEAHRMKNPKALRTKALAQLIKSMPSDGVRIMMSGTPAPNGRASELATALELVDGWSTVSKGTFWHYYCPPAKFGREHLPERVQELGEKCRSTFMLRRLRGEVLTLPNKGRSAIAVEGKGTAVRKYISAEEDLIEFLSGEGRSTEGAGRAEALVRLTTLRALAGQAKVDGAVTLIKEMLEDDPSGILVIAEHQAVMDALEMAFIGKAVSIRGGMTDKQKSDAVDMFNGGHAQVLIGQITSAGVGFTLHGGGRNHRVVVVQLPWTPAELQQAEDRLHRIGQTHDVEVTIVLTHIDGKWSIDERLWGLLEQKAFSATAMINGEGEFLTDSEIREGLLDTYR
jgi:SWI/SNF-related matrix-associated actin-dependent regulator 1 of chromatin subfamily A